MYHLCLLMHYYLLRHLLMVLCCHYLCFRYFHYQVFLPFLL